MRGDPIAQYRCAVQAYVQSFRLWTQSRDLAHRNIAAACLAIAREKQVAMHLQLRRGRQHA